MDYPQKYVMLLGVVRYAGGSTSPVSLILVTVPYHRLLVQAAMCAPGLSFFYHYLHTLAQGILVHGYQVVVPFRQGLAQGLYHILHLYQLAYL